MRGILISTTNAVFNLQILVTQTLVQTPEPKFSPSGPRRIGWSGGEGGREEQREAAGQGPQELLVTHLE